MRGRWGSCWSSWGCGGIRSSRLPGSCRAGSGGGFSCLRILVGEPNVLLLDEPTNDLDVDTLTELEDLLDGWAGSLVVVSHDRYFLERVTDHVLALLGDGKLSFLAGGIEEYLERRGAGVRTGTAAVFAPERRGTGRGGGGAGPS